MLVCSRCFNAFVTVDRCPLDGVRLVRADQVQIARTIGRYAIESLRAEGRTSRLFRAVDRDTNRPVALKIFHGEIACDRMLAGKLVLRAKASAKIDAVRFVPVLEADLTPSGLAYVAREHVEGVSLAESLHFGGARPPSQAANILQGLALCLSKVHWAGQVYGDLRPGAVMLAGEPGRESVRLLDAAALDLLRPTAQALGFDLDSSAFVSPEEVAGEAATSLSDLYVLGVILHALLVGYPPFTTRQAHIDEPVPAVVLEHGGLTEIARALLEKDPAKRPQAADAVLARVERLGIFDGPRAAESAPPMPPPDASSSLGAGRRRSVAVGVGLGALSLAAVLWVYRRELLPQAKERASVAPAVVPAAVVVVGPEPAIAEIPPDAAPPRSAAAPSEPAQPARVQPAEKELPKAVTSTLAEKRRGPEDPTAGSPSPSDELAAAFSVYDGELGRALSERHLVWAELAAAAPAPARQWGRWYKREAIRSMDVLSETFGALREAVEHLAPATKTSTRST